MSIRHGGELACAVNLYGGTAEQWLDLSTGISPWNYPIGDISAEVWRQLPSSSTQLIDAAADYYKAKPEFIIVTPGSQLAIRLLPTLLDNKQSVAVPDIGYQEHAHSWKLAGHVLVYYNNEKELETLITERKVQHAIIINPNNPTAEIIAPENIKHLAAQLPGLMLLDEAFADCNNKSSLSQHAGTTNSNILVLRSIGKFFGLAGARVGFLIGSHSLATQLNELLSPWSINAPAQAVAIGALRDQQWQQQQRARIQQQSMQAKQAFTLLIDKSTLAINSHALFNTISGDAEQVESLHLQFAEHKIWTRLGDAKINQGATTNWLRCSLPGLNFERFAIAVQSLTI